MKWDQLLELQKQYKDWGGVTGYFNPKRDQSAKFSFEFDDTNKSVAIKVVQWNDGLLGKGGPYPQLYLHK